MINSWHPTYIRRSTNKTFDTGAGAVVVETDAGRGYLKGIGNPGGEHVLACEYVGTQLATWFGLPTLEYGIIQVTFAIKTVSNCMVSRCLHERSGA